MMSYRFRFKEAYLIGGILWVLVTVLSVAIIVIEVVNSEPIILKEIVQIPIYGFIAGMLIRRFVINAYKVTEDTVSIASQNILGQTILRFDNMASCEYNGRMLLIEMQDETKIKCNLGYIDRKDRKELVDSISQKVSR